MSYRNKGAAGLALGALGVVFGDIGTNPLYVMRVVFGRAGRDININATDVHGILSLIIWSVTLVVSIKYVGLVMRANNKGEGGIMALVSLIKGSDLTSRYKWRFILLGIVGVSLFYGDSAITPAVSVLSAVEGLKVIQPGLHSLVVPITFVILALLFWVQKYGTAFIGRLFGPVMLLWFAVIAAGGLGQILAHPSILISLSPVPAVVFFVREPLVAFLAMSAVVLAVTGAEALYADMGHFGRKPIARAWFAVVFPALILCYMGQGALMLAHPAAIANPFMLLFPESVRFSIVVLATLATMIASQSVISGAFSLTHQAVQLDFLPRMLVRHTSEREYGQIYMPFVNLLLFVAVSLLVFTFGSSVRLAGAYGMAVSGALALDTILFVVIMRVLWHRSIARAALVVAVFSSLDLLFVASNLSKISHGGWVPLTFAAVILLVTITWIKGRRITAQERSLLEGPLQNFIDEVHNARPLVKRIPGQVIYIGHHADRAPLALHATVEELHELSQKAVLVTVDVTDEAHIPEVERAVIDDLRYKDDGISHVTLRYGFHDVTDIPRALRGLSHTGPELGLDPDAAAYFVSLSKVVRTGRHNMMSWQKTFYSFMARNALSSTDYYRLPVERTVEMRSLIKL